MDALYKSLHIALSFCLRKAMLPLNTSSSIEEQGQVVEAIVQFILSETKPNFDRIQSTLKIPAFRNFDKFFGTNIPLCLGMLQVDRNYEYIFSSGSPPEIQGSIKILENFKQKILNILQETLKLEQEIAHHFLLYFLSGHAIIILPNCYNQVFSAISKAFAEISGNGTLHYEYVSLHPIELVYGYRCTEYLEYPSIPKELINQENLFSFMSIIQHLQQSLMYKKCNTILPFFELTPWLRPCDSCLVRPATLALEQTSSYLCTVCYNKRKESSNSFCFETVSDFRQNIGVMYLQNQLFTVEKKISTMFEYFWTKLYFIERWEHSCHTSLEKLELKKRIHVFVVDSQCTILIGPASDMLLLAYLLGNYYESYRATKTPSLISSQLQTEVMQKGINMGICIAHQSLPITRMLETAKQAYYKVSPIQHGISKTNICFTEIGEMDTPNTYSLRMYAEFLQEVSWVYDVPVTILQQICTIFSKGDIFAKHCFYYQVARNSKLHKFIDTIIRQRKWENQNPFISMEKVLWRNHPIRKERYSPFLEYVKILKMLGKQAKQKIAKIEKELSLV